MKGPCGRSNRLYPVEMAGLGVTSFAESVATKEGFFSKSNELSRFEQRHVQWVAHSGSNVGKLGENPPENGELAL